MSMLANERRKIPQGTLDMLILKLLSRKDRLHGFEIANHIQVISQDVLQVEEGSLYPALQRMLMKRWLEAEWGNTAENRRARYYAITARGRKRLEEELLRYSEVSTAIGRILKDSGADSRYEKKLRSNVIRKA